MSKDNDVVAPDEAAPLVFAVQGDPQRTVYRDDADGRVRLRLSMYLPRSAWKRRQHDQVPSGIRRKGNPR